MSQIVDREREIYIPAFFFCIYTYVSSCIYTYLCMYIDIYVCVCKYTNSKFKANVKVYSSL